MYSFGQFLDGQRMHGSRRVVIFCLLTTILPAILIVLPLYLRNSKYADVMYKISDSDVIQIHKGQSSIFCQKHSLTMNSTFSAFQMRGMPELDSIKRKHIKLKKSMVLPDDTLEYWGFYLFKGATVELKACSRYEGSKILVVKGGKTLNTCGILEGNEYKKNPPIFENQGVSVTIEKPNQKKRQNRNPNTHMIDDEENVMISILQSLDKKYSNDTNNKRLRKREAKIPPIHNPNTVLDTGVNHGGNAFNGSYNATQDSAVSSFENNLHRCYEGNIILNELFPFSIQCKSTNYLEETTTLKVVHEVLSDGYYYYIFYSDNDIIQNDIHVLFDIYKPTFQYTNMPESKSCVNQTSCEFDINFFSDELVIVEMPTKDGFRNDDDATSILISVCHPRVSVYVFFPVAVLLLILLFAFL